MDNFSLDAPNKQNYYEVLGLQDNSTRDQVIQAFRNITQLYIDGQTHEQETEAETMPTSRFQQSCEALLVLRDGTQGDKLLDFESFEKAIVSGGYAAIKGDALLNLFYKYVKTVAPTLQKQSSSPADTSLKGSLYKSQTDDNYISDKDLESDSGSEISEDEDTNEKTDSGDDNKPFDADKKDNEFRSEDFVNFANMDPFSSMLGVQIEEDPKDNKKFQSLEKFASRSVTFISDDKVKCNLCEDVIDQDELVEHLEEDHDDEFKRFKKDQKKKAQTKKSMLSAGR